VIGGSAGIGLESARLARAEGAGVILAARDPERLRLPASSTRRCRSRASSARATSRRWPSR
jgi:NADP-dependent 3-hydroxy acid dehydrogenase YdfG